MPPGLDFLFVLRRMVRPLPCLIVLLWRRVDRPEGFHRGTAVAVVVRFPLNRRMSLGCGSWRRYLCASGTKDWRQRKRERVNAERRAA
jgi:hypothetical protein